MQPGNRRCESPCSRRSWPRCSCCCWRSGPGELELPASSRHQTVLSADLSWAWGVAPKSAAATNRRGRHSKQKQADQKQDCGQHCGGRQAQSSSLQSPGTRVLQEACLQWVKAHAPACRGTRHKPSSLVTCALGRVAVLLLWGGRASARPASLHAQPPYTPQDYHVPMALASTLPTDLSVQSCLLGPAGLRDAGA